MATSPISLAVAIVDRNVVSKSRRVSSTLFNFTLLLSSVAVKPKQINKGS